jgi:hypothetical protein
MPHVWRRKDRINGCLLFSYSQHSLSTPSTPKKTTGSFNYSGTIYSGQYFTFRILPQLLDLYPHLRAGHHNDHDPHPPLYPTSKPRPRRARASHLHGPLPAVHHVTTAERQVADLAAHTRDVGHIPPPAPTILPLHVHPGRSLDSGRDISCAGHNNRRGGYLHLLVIHNTTHPYSCRPPMRV